MYLIRSAHWPKDSALLDGLDTSFTTAWIYRVDRNERAFALVEERVDPPLRKDYGPSLRGDLQVAAPEHAFVAEDGGTVIGFAGASYEDWSRRLVIRHLYVAPERRGAGVGRTLMRALETGARAAGARCLWVETQTVNVPAIRFYRRLGFRLCGLDDSLYDPAGPGGGEVALFFVRDVG